MRLQAFQPCNSQRLMCTPIVGGLFLPETFACEFFPARSLRGTKVYAHPLDRFSKLGYSTTRMISIRNDTFSGGSLRHLSNAALSTTGTLFLLCSTRALTIGAESVVCIHRRTPHVVSIKFVSLGVCRRYWRSSGVQLLTSHIFCSAADVTTACYLPVFPPRPP